MEGGGEPFNHDQDYNKEVVMIMIMVILMIKMKVSFNFRLRKNESLSHSYEWDEDLRQVHFKLDRMAEQVGHGPGSYIQVTPVLGVSGQDHRLDDDCLLCFLSFKWGGRFS